MKQSYCLSNKEYILFCSSNLFQFITKELESSISYSNGLEFLTGSDTENVMYYLVNKNKYQKFENTIEEYLEQTKDLDFKEDNPPYFLKLIEQDELSIYLSNFNEDSIQNPDYASIGRKYYESLVNVAETVMSFGSSSALEDITKFIVTYLYYSNPDDINNLIDSNSSEYEGLHIPPENRAEYLQESFIKGFSYNKIIIFIKLFMVFSIRSNFENTLIEKIRKYLFSSIEFS